MKKWMFILIVIPMVSGAQQLPVYSGYYLNKYVVNPAITGSEQFVDIRLQHRSQWLGMDLGPSTQILSAHSSIDKKNYGIGGYFYNDRTGVWGNSGASLSYAYHAKINDEVKLGFGLSGSFTQYRLNGNKALLEHENDLLVDIASRSTTNEWNTSFGMLLYHDAYYFGASVLNILEPRVEYWTSTKTPLTQHFYLLMGRKYQLNNEWIMEASAVGTFVDRLPLQVDGRIDFEYARFLRFGMGYRYQDAAILSVGFYITPELGLHYCYDFVLSNMKYRNKGSHEIMISYNLYYKPMYKKPRPQYKWFRGKGGVIDGEEGG